MKPQFYSVWNFNSSGHALAEAEPKKWGVISRKCGWVLGPAAYDGVSPYFSEIWLYGFRSKGATLFLNHKGEARVPLGYDASLEQ